MSDVPALIPRRLVFRALADICGGRARHFAGLSARTQARRPGAVASADKQRGHENTVQELMQAADVFSRCVSASGGPGVDAAVFGYLVALAYGHAEAFRELAAELADLGRPDLLNGLAWRDLVAIVERITA